MRSMMLTLTLALLIQGLAIAQDGLVTARTIDGAPVQGVLASVGADGEVVLRQDGKETRIAAASLISLAWGGASLPQAPTNNDALRFELAGGDVIYGVVGESTYDDVSVASTGALAPIRIALDRVRQAVCLEHAATLTPTFGADAPADRDVLFVRSKDGIDKVIGEVGTIGKQGISFTWGDKQESTFDYKKDKVVAVRLAAAEAPAPFEGVTVVVHLRDRTRLSGRLVKKNEGPPTIDIGGGTIVTLRDGAIAQVVFRGGAFDHLSDLTPVSAVETPYFEGGIAFGLARDANLEGGPATIAKTYFPKAVGAHSRSILTYDLGGRYESFDAAIGVDGAVASRPMRGAVAFSIDADGKPLLAKTIVRAGEEPKALGKLSVKGVKTLVIRIDFADNHHFNGWGVVGGGVLVRAK